jgi:hypothetical protein
MTQITQEKALVESSNPTDRVGYTKTIFDVSAFEIFWRNFLAGMARALGAVLLYFVILVIAVNIFLNLIYPVLEPIISQYTQALETFNRFAQPSPDPSRETSPNPQELRDLMQSPQFQQLLPQ